MPTLVTSICWGVVVVVWVAGAVAGLRRERPRRRDDVWSGALWRIAGFAAAVLLLRFARVGLHHAADHARWIELAGAVLLVASTAFALWARVALGRMWSASPGTLQAEHRLRTDGPYAVTRHPIYTGLLGMLLGTVLVNGLGAWLAVLLVGAAFLATRIPVEERLMSETFPAEYDRYRERVPMLVPGLRPRRRG